MQIRIEFFGLSRVITGKRIEAFDISDDATFQELVLHLARAYPELIPNVIQPDLKALQQPNAFYLEQKRFIQPNQMDQAIGPANHIVLMSISAGG